MRRLLLLSLLLPTLGSAQVSASAQIRFDLPVVLPQLVVVSPGIQVVPSVGYEVFRVDGFYWVRHGGRWYRSRSHQGGWVVMQASRVPPGLTRIPPGHYRYWKPEKGKHGDAHARGNGKGRKEN
jgi:hypothetical protein